MALQWARRDSAPSPALIPSLPILNDCFYPPSTRRNARNNNDGDDEEEEEEEEEEEDDSDEDEEGEGPSSVPGEPELTRAERRELKKKQAEGANKAGDGETADGDGEEDDLIANPNRITKKLNISDLSAPRELTRRERYARVTSAPFFHLFSLYLSLFFSCVGSKRRRRKPRTVIGR
jgi:hypothetical protein